jgi:ketosteroid isomerase-like protein
MGSTDVELVRRGYDAFARRDFDAIGELLAPDVRWHGHDEENPLGGCRSSRQVIDFIRGALAQGKTVEVLEVRDAGDQVLVVLQADRKDEDGAPMPHGELVSVRDGKITSMIVYETVDEAARAAQAT